MEGEVCLPCCSTLDLCHTSPDVSVPHSLAAHTPQNAVWPWEEYRGGILRVQFLNASFLREKGWTVGIGESMNTVNILDWANIWNKKAPEIPTFVVAKPREPAEIRVLFNGK